MQKRQPLTKLLPAALICAAVLSPAGAAETKNEITVAVASTFTTMDPWNATDTLSQAVAKSFYEGLFKFDRAMNVVPSLAESAESSPDGMQHVVHLRRGVKFHDGTTFTAEAVKANFDRITTPGSTLKRFSFLKTSLHSRSSILTRSASRLSVRIRPSSTVLRIRRLS